MGALNRYTELQRQTFVNRAAEIGMHPAMKELGFPAAKPTASRWCKDLGVVVEVSALQQYAADLKTFYGAAEKLALLQKVLDECYEMLTQGEEDPEDEMLQQGDNGQVYITYQRKPLSALILSRLASTIQSTIQTMELLEGRVTDRIEVGPDSTDIELISMIAEYRVRNTIAIEELRRS